MTQEDQLWHTTMAQRYQRLYTCAWQTLEPVFGAETALEVIAFSMAAVQASHPFLTSLVWQSQGLEAASVAKAIATVSAAEAEAGCERLLQEIEHLTRECAGPLLAQHLHTAIERCREAVQAPSETRAPQPEDAGGFALTSPELVRPLLHSVGRQAVDLYRRLYERPVAHLERQPASGAEVAMAQSTATSGINAGDLARSETFYHDLFDLSPDGVLVTSTHGVIFQANRQLATILEFDTPAELIGRSVTEFLVHPELRDTFWERIALYQRVEGQLREMRTRRGRRIIIVYSSRLINYEGRPCLLSVLRDVTERARLRREMEDFAYSASHDLQAPLRTFEGYARWLLEDYGDVLDTTGQQLCQEIIDDALHMKKLLDGLLEYSRIARQHTEAVPVEVAQVLDRVLHDLQIEIVDTDASIDIPEDLPTVVYPEVRLTQIFTNLVSNALKFLPPGRSPSIVIGCEEQEQSYRFTVSDNGIGIDPKHYGRIFEIFKRLHTREEYPGTGAGLTIVKKIVESYGGQIGVESTLGEGSTFWFTIPKTEEAQ
jgi:PAS domain S-box-containing protein